MGVPYAEVIGDPIAHSKSPAIHKFWLEKLGLECDYRATRVTPGELPAYLAARRADPRLVRLQRHHPLETSRARTAGRAGLSGAFDRRDQCDCRRGTERPVLVGHNTDAEGFLGPLKDWPGLMRNYRLATLIGTGGGAAAVAWALQGRISCSSYTAERSSAPKHSCAGSAKTTWILRNRLSAYRMT